MLIKSDEINKNKKIMVYMGSYIKDRSEGKYNDVITYSDNYEASYKSYMNLKTGEVCNIDIQKCSEFENKNFIIKMQGVIDNNFDSYLVNYTNLKNWYLKQLETRSEDDVIEELRQQYENKLEIDRLKSTRESLETLELELSKINEQRKILQDKINEIQSDCNHELFLKVEKLDLEGECCNKGICLLCNRIMQAFFPTFEIHLKNIMSFDDKEFSDLSEEEKVDLALKMFEEERENNPELSDSKIVEIINNRLKNDKENIKGKVLSNKPESVK